MTRDEELLLYWACSDSSSVPIPSCLFDFNIDGTKIEEYNEYVELIDHKYKEYLYVNKEIFFKKLIKEKYERKT